MRAILLIDDLFLSLSLHFFNLYISFFIPSLKLPCIFYTHVGSIQYITLYIHMLMYMFFQVDSSIFKVACAVAKAWLLMKNTRMIMVDGSDGGSVGGKADRNKRVYMCVDIVDICILWSNWFIINNLRASYVLGIYIYINISISIIR